MASDGMEHVAATSGQKWFLAAIVACPPCLAAGLAAMGGGLSALFVGLGLWLLAGSVLAATALAVIVTWRRRRACRI